MKDYTQAPKILQDVIIEPHLSSRIASFFKENNAPSTLGDTALEYTESLLCGNINFEELATKLKFECGLDDEAVETFMSLVGRTVGEEGIAIVLKYDINKPFAAEEQETPQIKPVQITTVKTAPTAPDNRSIRDRLFDALAPFTLHVDEQAVIAKEVEKYVKGETRAVDVGAHIAAMIDAPVSTVSKIIESLNVHIFVPLKKQIVEEKAHDLHDSDEALTQALLGKPAKKSGPLSFVPHDLLKTIEQKKKEDIFSDLRSVGGTPSGASLLSQEIKKEQKIDIRKNEGDASSIQIMPKKSYSVDPYREIM